MSNSILIVEPDRIQHENLLQLLAQQLNETHIEKANTLEEANRILKNIGFANKEISLVITTQKLPDGLGTTLLSKIYEQFPHSIRILLADTIDQIPETELTHSHPYRFFLKPYQNLDFQTTITEAFRLYTHRQELNHRSKILNELHRASLNLTGEINFDKLLHKLMRIVIDNADAINAYIILQQDNTNTLYIEAEGHNNDYETKIKSIEVTETSPVCPAIAEYAQKTRENIILNDALNQGHFTTHPYIRKNLSRSILCAPLVYQSKLYGLLYLDNNQKTNAFSPYSLELFRLLSAPAAIAIQNAQLYSEMEAKVTERTEQVIHQKVEIETQRDQIKQKNDDIMGSIRYARRIQDAFLPKISEIKDFFPQSFVYYKPKDVVSGDFFWFARRLSKCIMAVCDCTGHGIPGAFITVMANTILRQIVELEGIFKPDEILYQMNLRIRNALQQQHDASTALDGLDVAICQIDVRRNRVQYAGANRPLVILRKGEIIEYKPEKYGVGGVQIGDYLRVYTNHTIELQPNDTLYIFSDGYPDQFGEEINKRFKSHRFYQLLQDYQNKEMDHQQVLLDAELRHWRGDMEQTDDVLVIGIKF